MKTQKSAEAGCLKILSLPNFFFFIVYVVQVTKAAQIVFLVIYLWRNVKKKKSKDFAICL